MADLYLSLSYNEYKKLEEQLRDWENIETVHMTMDERFYHKALRLDMGDIVLEIQGPRVMAPPIADMDDDKQRAEDIVEQIRADKETLNS